MTCAEQEETVECLQKEVSAVERSYEGANVTIGVEVEELERKSLQVQNDLEIKSTKYEELRAHEGLLQGRIQELDKAIASTYKLKSEVEAENKELEQTVNELSDHFSGNKEKEFSLEQELKDNTDFRQDVQERFLLYKERREQKLKMLKTTLRSSISRNALMRKQYECVQGEYLALISKMLDELEKEDSTMTVTDMQQVCQSSMYFNMFKLPHSCSMFRRIFHSA
jgi:chromosome segregation ATPase